jgi:hypothetical protein
MRTLRAVLVWLVALAVLLAGPASSLAECLRCPPDCPMHARAERADEHSEHAGRHADHAGMDGDCHRKTPEQPRSDRGPCLSGVCGHMDVSLARALPEAVLAAPRALAPPLASLPGAVAPPVSATRPGDEPPTDPPRPLA